MDTLLPLIHKYKMCFTPKKHPRLLSPVHKTYDDALSWCIIIKTLVCACIGVLILRRAEVAQNRGSAILFWADTPKETVPPGRGGGGGGTASLKVTTHCQTTAPVFSGLSATEFSLTPPIVGSCRPLPSKIKLSQCKFYTKVPPVSHKAFHVIGIVFHKIVWKLTVTGNYTLMWC